MWRWSSGARDISFEDKINYLMGMPCLRRYRV